MESMEYMDTMESVLSMEMLDSMVSESDMFSRMRFASNAFSIVFLRFTFSTSPSTHQAFRFIAFWRAIPNFVLKRLTPKVLHRSGPQKLFKSTLRFSHFVKIVATNAMQKCAI